MPGGVRLQAFGQWLHPAACQQRLGFLCDYADNDEVQRLGARGRTETIEDSFSDFRWWLRPGQNPAPFKRWLEETVNDHFLAKRLHENEKQRIHQVLKRLNDEAPAAEPALGDGAAAPAVSPDAPSAPSTPHQPPAPAAKQQLPPQDIVPQLFPEAHDEDEFSGASGPSGSSGTDKFITSDDDDSVGDGNSSEEWTPRHADDDDDGAAAATPRFVVPALLDSDGESCDPETAEDTCLEHVEARGADTAGVDSSSDGPDGPELCGCGVRIVADPPASPAYDLRRNVRQRRC